MKDIVSFSSLPFSFLLLLLPSFPSFLGVLLWSVDARVTASQYTRHVSRLCPCLSVCLCALHTSHPITSQCLSRTPRPARKNAVLCPRPRCSSLFLCYNQADDAVKVVQTASDVAKDIQRAFKAASSDKHFAKLITTTVEGTRTWLCFVICAALVFN